MVFIEFISNFLRDFFKILGEMAPYLLLGFFFAGLLHAFIPKYKIDKYFNGNAFQSSLRSSLLGIPMPLCSCGVIPTGAALYRNGASKGSTLSFLISTPQTGIDSILATFSLMGLPFAIIRPIAALFTGVSGGLITNTFVSEKKIIPKDLQDDQRNESFGNKLIKVFKYGFIDFIQDISKWLLIGLFLAALISALIPDDFFALLNLPPIFQMLLILVVSIPLYICATGSIPLAAILILKGISPGAAFVLLMAGPASNAATITMVAKVLGKKSLLIYLTTIVAGALVFGTIIDYVLPVQWFTTVANQDLAHNHNESINLTQIISGISLIALIINGYFKKFLNRKNKNKNTKTSEMEKLSLKVEGMTCNHCKANVESEIQQLDFVKNVEVNLSHKTVEIEGKHIMPEIIKKSIESIGYKVIS